MQCGLKTPKYYIKMLFGRMFKEPNARLLNFFISDVLYCSQHESLGQAGRPEV
jgi:hypothetical protein